MCFVRVEQIVNRQCLIFRVFCNCVLYLGDLQPAGLLTGIGIISPSELYMGNS